MGWKIWVDTGGTFTDCLGEDEYKQIHRCKVLSSGQLRGRVVEKISSTTYKVDLGVSLEIDIFKGYTFALLQTDRKAQVISYDSLNQIICTSSSIDINQGDDIALFAGEEAPILAARVLTQTPLDAELPIEEFRLGSTKGTNALLELKGERVHLITTKGFKDVLKIGTQQRNELFTLNITKPIQYTASTFELEEQVNASGEVIIQPMIEQFDPAYLPSKESVIVISFKNAFLNDTNEQCVKKHLKNLGYQHVICGTELSQDIKYVERTQTAVINGYLLRVLESYLDRVEEKLPEGSLKIVTSAGGLVSRNAFHPKDSLFSGPAGGMIGASLYASICQSPQLITFDMGGTSSDVSRYYNGLSYTYESKIGDAVVQSPAIYLETIAAGGGSICAFNGVKFTVGPESAGASPGPACYGAGGPLTITDVNFLLGRLNTSKFRIPLNKAHAEKALQSIVRQVPESHEQHILAGFFEIATEKMAEAIRNISVKEGYLPQEFSLLAFGGAGGLHACAIAEKLKIETIIIPYDAGILSAYGMQAAKEELWGNQQVLEPLREVSDIKDRIKHLQEDVISQLAKQSNSRQDEIIISATWLHLRLKGQDAALEIPYVPSLNIEEAFQHKYTTVFGHWTSNRAIELAKITVKAARKGNTHFAQTSHQKIHQVTSIIEQKIYSHGKWSVGAVYDVDKLQTGDYFSGPAILTNQTGTTCIDEGWEAIIDEQKNVKLLLVEQSVYSIDQVAETQLELYTNRFNAIALDMGAMLQRTAFSVNVKERMDFSCALMDHRGQLVVNAPHIPVHLGALGLCVKLVTKVLPLHEGDIAITNHPGFGGSHLPDVTLIAPVYVHHKLIGYVANRAHHAEIGGKSPGSMPADASKLVEEGVVITPQLLRKKGVVDWEAVRTLLCEAAYPTRSVEENISDLIAGVASIEAGIQRLTAVCQNYGIEEVVYFMELLGIKAADKLHQKLLSTGDFDHEATESLDDGSIIHVQLINEKGHLTIDFTGTSETHQGNLNATPAIVQSVVLYFLRLFVGQNIPLNEGLLRHVSIVLSDNTFLNPLFPEDDNDCPAVVGGNVEVSQRLVDTLLKALKLAACSQGTMNNLLFGNDDFGFYETICGGVGATSTQDGADAVHQHMTNTRITDAEIMENRYPIEVDEFSIRNNSGGTGKFNGGNGIIRQLKFKAPLTVTVMTEHRKISPYGLHGGNDGQCGAQKLLTTDGKVVPLKGKETFNVHQGDSIIIETPGGGGYGIPEE